MPNLTELEEEASCADRPIKSVMHPFSYDFLSGCIRFADAASKSDSPLIDNTACLMFANAFMEAKLNEWIAISQICFEEDLDSIWHELSQQKKSLDIVQKWNKIAGSEGGEIWDSGREPYQSYEMIICLRNEIVHYKADFLPKDTPPVKRIKTLMDSLGVASQASFIEDDCSAWAHDLLGSNALGPWVAENVSRYDENVLAMLGGGA